VNTPTDRTTLADAKDWLRGKLDEGAECPLCTQRVQTYKRKLNLTMVRALALLARGQKELALDVYLHAPTVLEKHAGLAREVGKLAYWDLVIEGSNKRTDGGHAGMWRVSLDGIAFLRGEKRVRKYAKVYNGRRLGFDGEMVSVKDVAGAFDLRELLAGI
jgi:hypothetical protein